MMSGTVAASNGPLPVAANTIVAAHANRSAAGPIGWSRICSGAMKAGVPTGMEVMVEVASSALAMPKSITRGPSAPRMTLAGLKSRCTMPAWWTAARAVAVPTARRRREAPVRGPCSATARARDGPSTYSLMM
ncbi:hypothetical protein BKM31_24560 [[Actinomadura] parvosata subsp. kistnae]|uniref:Uncharacterized protein n=1 Tax=[Actinomadura] parvosata subsp. kistnae TaxID=1909395 RepID=A0A1V0A1Z9_9ACTN|nr:hypothetical protein BKM31_24560 [Nonomuraea sp. ATCC 55076]